MVQYAKESKNFISRAALDLSYIERSVFEKDVTTKAFGFFHWERKCNYGAFF